MSNELATLNADDMLLAAEAAIANDLTKLNPAQKVQLIGGICKSMGLNPTTQPFQLLKLQGKETLYATKNAAEQLRRIYGVNVTKIEQEIADGLITVTCHVTDKYNRQDVEIGVVAVGNAAGETLANAKMKAMTKAKRRATLSICGLGFLDDSEVDSIPGAVRQDLDYDTGEIIGTSSVVVEDAPVRALPEVDHETQTAREGAWRLAESYGFTPQTHVKFFKHITGVHPRQASKAQADAVSAALDGLTEEQITSVADGAATIAEIMGEQA